jgi:hypothetical protein
MKIQKKILAIETIIAEKVDFITPTPDIVDIKSIPISTITNAVLDFNQSLLGDEVALEQMQSELDRVARSGSPIKLKASFISERISMLRKTPTTTNNAELTAYTNFYLSLENECIDDASLEQIYTLVSEYIMRNCLQAFPIRCLQRLSAVTFQKRIEEGTSIDEVESEYDILSRKFRTPPLTILSEYDMAKLPSQKGLAIESAYIEQGHLNVRLFSQEKVYSLGFKGALEFMGKKSEASDSRVYGVLLPKGLIEANGCNSNHSIPQLSFNAVSSFATEKVELQHRTKKPTFSDLLSDPDELRNLRKLFARKQDKLIPNEINPYDKDAFITKTQELCPSADELQLNIIHRRVLNFCEANKLLFMIRHEKSTKKGQVHLYKNWLVKTNGYYFESQVDYLRRFIIGVVEIDVSTRSVSDVVYFD